jgi:hypothetical protein
MPEARTPLLGSPESTAARQQKPLYYPCREPELRVAECKGSAPYRPLVQEDKFFTEQELTTFVISTQPLTARL